MKPFIQKKSLIAAGILSAFVMLSFAQVAQARVFVGIGVGVPAVYAGAPYVAAPYPYPYAAYPYPYYAPAPVAYAPPFAYYGASPQGYYPPQQPQGYYGAPYGQR